MLPSEEGKEKCPNCNNEMDVTPETGGEAPAVEAPAAEAPAEAPQPEADQS